MRGRKRSTSLQTTGDTEGDEIRWRNQLIEAHIVVATNIARGLVRRYGWILDPDDIEGCAMVGLCEAAARFDRGRAEPFVAFAEQRVRGAVFDEIRRLGMHSRVVNKRQRRISAARAAISQTGVDPSDDRVAEHLGLTLETVRSTPSRASRAQGGEVAALPSPCASPAAYFECAQFLKHLRSARAGLQEPDATVIRLHYDAGISLAHIARTLGLTVACIRHAHTRGLARIQDAMRENVAAGDEASLRDSIPYPSLYELEGTGPSK